MHRVVAATVLSIFLLAFAINRFLPAPEASAGSGGSSTNYTLTVQFQGTGTVHINPPNVNRTSNSTFTYAQNTVVNLSASAPAGWRFLRWENALTGSSPSGSVAMTSNKTVKAVFVQCKITVNKQGEGQVRIEPPDETLTPTFTKTYSGITTVTLTAIPATGWAFKEWTGDHAGTGNPATFEVDREETVTAVFEQIKLTVNKTGEGQVSATPPGGAQTPTFTEYYGTNTTVSLTAIPEPGWAFKEWTGAISSTSNPASVLVNGDKTVRAVFEEIKLTVEKSGDGQVNVDPPDTTALPTFTEEYTGATEVTLTAMPDPGWAFVEWTGDLTGTDNPSTLLVDGEKEVRAVFEERKLTVSKEGEGQVSASPPGGGADTNLYGELWRGYGGHAHRAPRHRLGLQRMDRRCNRHGQPGHHNRESGQIGNGCVHSDRVERGKDRRRPGLDQWGRGRSSHSALHGILSAGCPGDHCRGARDGVGIQGVDRR